jgi:hypothetical protein
VVAVPYDPTKHEEANGSRMTSEPTRRETYTHGHAPATLAQHARRTADEAAGFLLNHLLGYGSSTSAAARGASRAGWPSAWRRAT